MRVININEAQRHLSRLVEAAAEGESFAIEQAGQPIVKVEAFIASQPEQKRKTGFMSGITIPDDFDQMCADEIEELFNDPT